MTANAPILEELPLRVFVSIRRDERGRCPPPPCLHLDMWNIDPSAEYMLSPSSFGASGHASDRARTTVADVGGGVDGPQVSGPICYVHQIRTVLYKHGRTAAPKATAVPWIRHSWTVRIPDGRPPFPRTVVEITSRDHMSTLMFKNSSICHIFSCIMLKIMNIRHVQQALCPIHCCEGWIYHP